MHPTTVADIDGLTQLSAVARDPSIENSLRAVRDLLQMEVAYLTEFSAQEQVFVSIDGDPTSFGVAEGTRMALETTYCKRVIEGRLPNLIADVRAHPDAGAMPITEAAGVGAFVSVPIRRVDGRLYGTLCAASHAARPDLRDRDVRFLEVFARIVCDQLEHAEHQRALHQIEVESASIDALLAAVAARDAYTAEHTRAVVDLVTSVGARYGLSAEQLEAAAQVATLHDIGKVAIPDAVLLKPGPLAAPDWLTMRAHPEIGERIVRSVPALAHLGEAVRAEHERWDGSGYPDGLAGDAIPLVSRIVFVCDAFHAMTSDRPYRAAMSASAAIAELNACAGSQFDPRAVEALLGVLPQRGSSNGTTPH